MDPLAPVENGPRFGERPPAGGRWPARRWGPLWRFADGGAKGWSGRSRPISRAGGPDRRVERRPAALGACGTTDRLGRFGLAGGWAAAEVAVAEAVAVALEG